VANPPLPLQRFESPPNPQIKKAQGLKPLSFFYGGLSDSLSELVRPQIQLSKTIQFFHIPQYKNETFLRERYLEIGLSIAQIAHEISSSKSTVRTGLLKCGIPVREDHLPHNNRLSALSEPEIRMRAVNNVMTRALIAFCWCL